MLQNIWVPKLNYLAFIELNMSVGHDHKFLPVQKSLVSFVSANLYRIYSSLYQVSATEVNLNSKNGVHQY